MKNKTQFEAVLCIWRWKSFYLSLTTIYFFLFSLARSLMGAVGLMSIGGIKKTFTLLCFVLHRAYGEGKSIKRKLHTDIP